jgi:hypothetical protein
MAKKKAKQDANFATAYEFPRQPIAVGSSDNHLEDRAWQGRPSLEGDAYHAFAFMVDYAIQHGLPLLLGGDVIDKQRNESRLARFLVQQLERCEQHNVPVLFIQGQHELQDFPWLKSLGDNVAVWLHRNVWSLGGESNHHVVYGIDWTPADKLPEELAAVNPQATILLMHQVCDEWMGSLCATELRWDMIPGHIQLVIVGDYHGAHTRLLRKNAEGRDLVVLCPGSTVLQAIDEPAVKQFFVLYDDLSTESIEIPGRPVLAPPPLLEPEHLDEFVTEVRNRCGEAVEQVEDTLPGHLCKPILYVKYDRDLPDAYKRIAAAVGDAAFLFPKELTTRRSSDEPTEEELAHQEVIAGGLLGALPQVAPDPESDLYRVSARLLTAVRPELALQELRQEFMDG